MLLRFCLAGMTVGNFPQFFKRFAAAGKFHPYHNLHAAFRQRRRYARHNLRRLIDRKTAFGFVFLSVGSAKEYALRTVLFIDFEFFAFNQNVIADGKRSVSKTGCRVRNGGDFCRRLLYAQHFDGNFIKGVPEVGSGNYIDGAAVDFFIVGGIFRFPNAGNARRNLRNAVLLTGDTGYSRDIKNARKETSCVQCKCGECVVILE